MSKPVKRYPPHPVYARVDHTIIDDLIFALDIGRHTTRDVSQVLHAHALARMGWAGNAVDEKKFLRWCKSKHVRAATIQEYGIDWYTWSENGRRRVRANAGPIGSNYRYVMLPTPLDNKSVLANYLRLFDWMRSATWRPIGKLRLQGGENGGFDRVADHVADLADVCRLHEPLASFHPWLRGAERIVRTYEGP